MKAVCALLFLAAVLLSHGQVPAGAETPVEERLAGLQVEEVGLRLRYRAQSPKLLEVQAQIKALEEIEGIRNAKYYDCLAGLLAGLEKEREELAKKFRPGSPAMDEIEAKVAFVKKTIEARPGAEAESGN